VFVPQGKARRKEISEKVKKKERWEPKKRKRCK